MGAALSASRDPSAQALWRDWYRFTVDMAVAGAFSADEAERRMARSFIVDALAKAGRSADPFGNPQACRGVIEALPPSPEHMFFAEYNFLFVLAAGGRPDKASLGDHSPAGYRQRARFYAISPEGRLRYSRGVAAYIVFLAEQTGLAAPEICAAARKRLDGYARLEDLLGDIPPANA
jgi:hypothetical protein